MGYKNDTSRLREWIDTAMAVGEKIVGFHHYVVEMSCSPFEIDNRYEQDKDNLVLYATPCKEGKISPIGESVKASFNNDDVTEFCEEMRSVIKSPRCRIHVEVLPTFIVCIEATDEFPYRVEISGPELNLTNFTKFMNGSITLNDWLMESSTLIVGNRLTLYICNGNIPQVNNFDEPPVKQSKKVEPPIPVPEKISPTLPTTEKPDGLEDDVLSFMNEATKSVQNMKENEEQCVKLGEESKAKIDEIIKTYTDAVNQEKSEQMRKNVEQNLNKIKEEEPMDDDDMFDESEDVNSSSISVGDDEDSSLFLNNRTIDEPMENPVQTLIDKINKLPLKDQKVLAEAVTLNKDLTGPLGDISKGILTLPINLRTSIISLLHNAMNL